MKKYYLYVAKVNIISGVGDYELLGIYGSLNNVITDYIMVKKEK